MERSSSVLRWAIIGIALLVLWKWVLPGIMGKDDGGGQAAKLPPETYVNAPGFVPDVVDPVPPGQTEGWSPAEGDLCNLHGQLFEAVLSSRGAGIKHFFLKDPKYAGTEANDMSTTPDVERWRSLRTLFRGEGAASQVRFDRFPWKLEASDGASCSFSYVDDEVRIDKVVRAGTHAYELVVETTVKNLATEARRHQFSIGMFAFRRNEEVKGSLGRVSPFVTELSCAHGDKVERRTKDEFGDGWVTVEAADRFAAVSNYYFGQALIPTAVRGAGDGAAAPSCRILAEEWFSAGQPRDDDKAGAVYHAALVYPARDLTTGQSVTYALSAYLGPKERPALAAVGNPQTKLTDLINLGFFSPVARVLVATLDFFHDHVTFGSWGAAIIVMTVCLRLILFPLSWKQIQVTIGMRKIKPELDALNVKFKGDPQAQQLAMMELYRKHGVNPLAGCLPQLAQMPIWFAMYTTLQTAVEMFHTRFWWFQDLSGPDKYYVLPVLLGGLMIVQQRLVPQQGMDPMQQKMMTYMLPAIFFVMMLFLPAALGVYMLTNSVLGIVQQLVVERLAPRNGSRDIVVKESTAETRGGSAQSATDGGSSVPPSRFGKGKARV